MAKIKITNLFDYLILLVIVCISIFLIISNNTDRGTVKIIAGSTATAYFFWGIFHQWRDRSLYLEVILEYGLYAILGVLPIILLT